MYDRGLSEEQRMMRQSCRDFVDDVVIPFIRQNWQREWIMTPEDRLPPEILEGADKIGIRTLGVPEEFGGIELDPDTEVQTFALISEEIARGDSGLADKLVQNWKVSVLLRNLAPRHLQEKWFQRLVEDPQFLLAHCLTEPRGASDRWLPYNVPEAAMQTTRGEEGRRVGDQRPQAVHLQRLRRQPLRGLCQHQSRRSACCRAPRRSWCRATRRASRSRAATRRWAAAS